MVKAVGIELTGEWKPWEGCFMAKAHRHAVSKKYGQQGSGEAGTCLAGSNWADEGGELRRQVPRNDIRGRFHADAVGPFPNDEERLDGSFEDPHRRRRNAC